MTRNGADAKREAGEIINAVASRQCGVVTRRQLIAAGLSVPRLRRILRSGFVRVLHRGVYAVGPVLVPRAPEMAAVLACGSGSFVSHRSAGALFGVLSAGAAADAVSVSRTSGYHRRPGIRVHRVRALPSDETTVLGGIPVTNAARTLVDLAAIVTARELEWAVAEALARALTESRCAAAPAGSPPATPGSAPAAPSSGGRRRSGAHAVGS
jgi:predicted transcriptional regulator of viral defense system